MLALTNNPTLTLTKFSPVGCPMLLGSFLFFHLSSQLSALGPSKVQQYSRPTWDEPKQAHPQEDGPSYFTLQGTAVQGGNLSASV